MPDGENGFYTDMKYGKKHYTFVSEELVNYTRKVFRLSRRRERTFVAGLSMGGYGAFRLALTKPEQYSAAASLSGCLDIIARLDDCPWKNEATAIWGEDFASSARGTDSDLMYLLDGTASIPTRNVRASLRHAEPRICFIARTSTSVAGSRAAGSISGSPSRREATVGSFGRTISSRRLISSLRKS